MKRKMKYLYFADMMGDIKEECESIKEILKENGINVQIETTELPPWDQDYDVLFFDYGGMMLGNSMMQSLCSHFIEQARNKPSRLYIMVSDFTKEAMEDMLREMKLENEENPKNIFLTIADAIPLLKVWE